MRAFVLLLFFSALLLSSKLSESRGERQILTSPPRGWNSYDSFSWIIDEEAFLQNAEVLAKRLLHHGYQYVVVDYMWYRKNAKGVTQDSYGYDNIDQWGRVMPDPDRWPSSRGGKGFKEVSQKVHDMGLKFGIHLMRGINAEAVSANTPILDVVKGGAYEETGRQWHAGDIGMKNMSCSWLRGFMSVNTDLGAGRAFLRSLYQQYAEWGVDFVKLDCVFGDDLDPKEIITVSELLEELDSPLLLSLSPGTHVNPSMAEAIYNRVDMYRITSDDWDKWEDVASHFNVARDFAAAKKIGAKGLHGNSWPDLDMLPFGWLTDPGVQRYPYRTCNLTLDEQRTQMTLWSMAKSPLMIGGDLRHIDESTFNLITNPTLLEINSYSANNMEFPHIFARKDIKHKEHVSPKRLRYPEQHVNSHNSKVLGLSRCSDLKAKGWFISVFDGEMDQICWKNDKQSSDNLPHCIYRRKPYLSLDEGTVYRQEYKGKFQLLVTKAMDACLEPSATKRRTASEIESTLLSTCTWNSKQMWDLNDNGTLVNNYSRLCVMIEPVKAIANVVGVRSWVATGRSGEIYFSFFNLNSGKTQISARIGDLAKALNNSFLVKGSCNCSEVWSGKHFVVEKTLSMMVEAHGCALFVLNCKN